MPDRNGSHQHASLPPSSLGFFTWKAGGDRTDGMRWMMLRYADMICSAVWFRKSSCCDPSATIGLWPIVATKSAMQQKALPSSTSIRQSSQNTLGHLHLQCFRNLTSVQIAKIFPAPRIAMLEIVGWSIQRACVVCVMPVVEDVVAMLCYGSPAMPKMFAPSTSFLQEIWHDMSASAKLVSLSAVSCASTSIISLFAIQYSYSIIYQEVIKYPSNIPQRLLYRCERKMRKRVSTWLTSTMSIKGFLGKSTFCSMVEDHIENDFNASTMKLS